MAGYIPIIDRFFCSLGQAGYDDNNGLLVVHVNGDDSQNAYWCRSDTDACLRNQMNIGSNAIAGDVVAHEFTHGVTEHFINFIYAGESGALSESYSDVFGNLAFEDLQKGQWRIGELSKLGAIRNMKNPWLSNPAQPSHIGVMSSDCLHSLDQCVHLWSGVPNIIAVYISDGIAYKSDVTGIGRKQLGLLYYETLSGGLLHESSEFVDQLIATLTECKNLAKDRVGGFIPADCQHVENAFDAAGIGTLTNYGWTRIETGLLGDGDEIDFYQGHRLYRGCTIADQILLAYEVGKAPKSSNMSNGLSVDMGGWGAYVIDRGSSSDLTNRWVKVRVWAEWFNKGAVDVKDLINIPAGLSKNDCYTPEPNSHPRVLYSSERTAHWATFFNGGSGDDKINQGIRMPDGCKVLSVAGLEDHQDEGYQMPIVDSRDHGSHGFTVSLLNPGDPRDVGVNMHWWHEGWSGIFVRTVYSISERDDVDCSDVVVNMQFPRGVFPYRPLQGHP